MKSLTSMTITHSVFTKTTWVHIEINHHQYIIHWFSLWLRLMTGLRILGNLFMNRESPTASQHPPTNHSVDGLPCHLLKPKIMAGQPTPLQRRDLVFVYVGFLPFCSTFVDKMLAKPVCPRSANRASCHFGCWTHRNINPRIRQHLADVMVV